MSKQWLLYGAYGYTGKLLTDVAIKEGLRPVLGGRTSDKLISLAEEKNLEYDLFSLEDQSKLNSIIGNYELVLNAAGPFKYTAAPIVNACLKNSTHYLDITGEIDVFEKNFTHHDEAKEKQIAIISGVGFDVVPSDCMAVYVSDKVENPIELELGIAALSEFSPGTMKTVIENLPQGAVVRREGKIEHVPFGKNGKKVKFPDRQREVFPIAWGDIATAYRSTNISNITTYMPLPKQFEKTLKLFGSAVRNATKLNIVKKQAKKWVEKNIYGPDEKTRETARSYVWAKAKNDKGESSEAWLNTIEAYKLTSLTGIETVKKVLNGEILGSLTPAQAFGKEFILEFPETEIIEHL
ncbi:MAG: saccharopine dehydrogenase [Candidatus Lokiarchaeota archaeon]|nr:saccharopine dehydrogenase [Candidatus Lokiarchaeota archaeon]